MLDKTFNFTDLERKHYDVWEESGAFRADPESDKPPYCIMMPPPNVTGSLHVGHALNHILQDILVRYKRRNGFDVLWQPGTDHASIAVHMVVEKELAKQGTDRFKLGREEFLKLAWEQKEKSAANIMSQLRRLGTTADWSRERFTMDEGLSKAVLKAFVDFYNSGKIYRAERLVNWDPERQSVISDMEVNMKDVKGKLWHIRYPIEGEEAQTITVATTRPETMLGDTAIAVHPEDDRYKHLIGKFAILPLVGRPIPIIADDYADPEQGSGAVKITPAHDFNDFEVGKRHDLPMVNVFDEKAHMNENVPEEYQGLERFTARKKILEELEAQELLVHVEDIKHAVPYGDRSGVVVEPFMTMQWFCDTPSLAVEAGNAVRDGRTKFVPKQYENMYFAWVDDQLPWCISRQLWWGHQIPAWYGPNGETYVALTEEEALAQAKENHGEAVNITRDEDVLDTWFSSGLWAFSTLGWPDKTTALNKYYPTDVLVTGFDIIPFWVSRMMFFAMELMGEVPFKDVYIHALVRDEKGQKMSKSKGNVIDPLDMIDQYGTDALRFTITSMAAQGRDIRLSEDRIAGNRNFTTKLWNASKYCEMNSCVYDPSFDPSMVQHTLNKWIIQSVSETKAAVDKALSNYRFNDASMALYQFTWNTFCDWYIEFTKLLFQDTDENIVKESKATTAWVLKQIIELLNPFMPYITEELNQAYFDSNDLLLTSDWPDYSAIAVDKDVEADVKWLFDIINEIRSVRADMNVPVVAKVPLLVKGADANVQNRFKTYQPMIKQMARIISIEMVDDFSKGAIQMVVDDLMLALPVAEFINLDQERARLQKEIVKLDGEVERIEQKLSNDQFVQNAPADIIQKQRDIKETALKTKEKLSQALKQLEAA